jgi:hypothetical protein
MVFIAYSYKKSSAKSLYRGVETVSRPPHRSTLDPSMVVRIHQGQLDLQRRNQAVRRASHA